MLVGAVKLIRQSSARNVFRLIFCYEDRTVFEDKMVFGTSRLDRGQVIFRLLRRDYVGIEFHVLRSVSRSLPNAIR